MGAKACVADVAALIGVVTGAEVVADDWVAQGWTEQARRVEQPSSWRRPWRVIAQARPVVLRDTMVLLRGWVTLRLTHR